jgi:2Fe-2S ferredoxin
MAKVHFKFEDKSKEPVVVDDAMEGMSILDIAEDNGVHLNHNCGAVCACSTCHVYVTKGMEHLPEISDREEDFIDRAIDPTIDSRLGCQCVLQRDDIEIEVTIPDQSMIIGHEH